jgi:WD40 repeat protein/serine/threonine protein kinase
MSSKDKNNTYPQGSNPESTGGEGWLKVAAQAPDFDFAPLSTPLGDADTLSAEAAALKPKTSLRREPERYQLEDEVARGGLGRIIRAQDRRLHRSVALKELLRSESLTEERFLREALLTAKLEHPSIVPIHDLGLTAEGKPYYAMKLIDGKSFDKIIEEKTSLEARLSLLPHVIDACQALAYAHSKRIIHRDLKPQNILVGSFGETVVVDWGLAKEIVESGKLTVDSAQKEKSNLPLSTPLRLPLPLSTIHSQLSTPPSPTELTQEGAIMGTPAYMPPEQAKGEIVDERADVYSLGTILYHVLTGEPPYTGRNSKSILLNLLRQAPTPLEERQPLVPKDLLAIVQKAMARSKDERYASAAQLAADLKSFQTGQIVGAYQYSTREKALRWLKRNRIIVGAAFAVMVAAMSAFVIVIQNQGFLTKELITTKKQRKLAEDREQEASEQRNAAQQRESLANTRADEALLSQARLSLERAPWRSLELLSHLSEDFDRYNAVRVIAADALSRGLPKILRGHTAAVSNIAFSPDGKLLASSSTDLTVRLWAIPGAGVQSGELLQTFRGHNETPSDIEFSPDGLSLASCDSEGAIWLWNLKTNTGRALKGHTSYVNNIVFSPDSKKLYSGSADKTIRIWDLASGESEVLQGNPSGITLIFLSPDGKTLASVDYWGTALWVWDLATQTHQAIDSPISSLTSAFSPQGEFLAFGNQSEGLSLWSIKDKTTRILQSTEAVANHTLYDLAFSPDGKKIAALDSGHQLKLWDVESGEPQKIALSANVSLFTGASLMFSSDGAKLAFLGKEGSINLLTLKDGTIETIRAHEGAAIRVQFSPDGKLLASAGQDGVIQIRDISASTNLVIEEHAGEADTVAFSPDGALIASGEDKNIRLWEPKTGASQVLEGHTGAIVDVRFSPNGEFLASSSQDKTVHIWNLKSMTSVAFESFGVDRFSALDCLSFSPDSSLLAFAGDDKLLRLWKKSEGSWVALKPLEGHQSIVRNLSFSPDSAYLLTAGYDHTARLWNLSTGESQSLTGHTAVVQDARFSPDGRLIATGSSDGKIQLWGVKNGVASLQKTFEAHEQDIWTLAFSPDSKTLVSGSSSGIVHLWDVISGEDRALLGHEAWAYLTQFSPNGKTLASVGFDGTLRLWGVENWRTTSTIESRLLPSNPRGLQEIAFSPDGTMLAAASPFGTVHLWRDDLPYDKEALREWLSKYSPKKPAAQ